MSSKHTKVLHERTHLRYGIWGMCVFLSLFSLVWLSRPVNAADTIAAKTNQRLVTVYDQGQEKTFVTTQPTIAKALRQEGIALESSDAVEPTADTKLVAKTYIVNIFRARSVIIEDEGQRVQVLTAQQSPKQILEEAGRTLYPEDVAHFALASNPLKDGGAGVRLVLKRARPFTLSLYGKTFEARSQASTIGQMLAEKNIVLGPQDGQSLPSSTPLIKGITVAVWRNGKTTTTQEETIAKPVEEVKDADKDYGTREVRFEGADGKKNVTYEIEMRDGKEISRTVIASVTTVEPVKQVVVVGTRFKGAYTTPSQNESITWEFLTNKGLSREQTAGIMGNLMQEHGFNTTGDGLAQWTGGRKAALLSRPDPYSINTQLDFLWYELSGPYASVLTTIRSQSNVEGAVRAFQNGYERCGVCVESRRIQYAYNILASH